MSSKNSENCPIDYQPGRHYTLEEFSSLNDWLKNHEFIFEGKPINHFERNADETLSAMPVFPIQKEAAVAQILFQLEFWNINFGQHGVCTGSQGGFKFGVGEIRVPDVAFTPRNTYCNLDAQQLQTFQGLIFCPTFVVEVDDFSSGSSLNDLTSKFKDTYFPAGVRLGWLIDPINKTIYTFVQESDGVVRRRQHQWYDTNGNPRELEGGDVLPISC